MASLILNSINELTEQEWIENLPDLVTITQEPLSAKKVLTPDWQ